MSRRSTGDCYPTVEARRDTVILELQEPVKTISSVDGVKTATTIVLHSIDEDMFRRLGYRRYRLELVKSLGLEAEKTIVLLTATSTSNFGLSLVEEPPSLIAASIGLTHPACIGETVLHTPPRTSTVNIVVWTCVELNEAGLIDLYRTVSEVKAVAMTYLIHSCRARSPGTVSDAVVVASPTSSGGLEWAGLATVVGGPIGFELLRLLLMLGSNWYRDRLRQLLGIGSEEAVSDGLKAYMSAPVPGVEARLVEDMLRKLIVKLLGDVNIQLLLLAARELDHYLAVGAVPGTKPGDDVRDPRGIVADEVLETALALYINGFRGLLAAYWIDREKHRMKLNLSKATVFTDDALASLIGSALSIIYDKLLEGHNG